MGLTVSAILAFAGAVLIGLPTGVVCGSLGFYDGEHSEYDTYPRLYFLPFRKISTRVRRAGCWKP